MQLERLISGTGNDSIGADLVRSDSNSIYWQIMQSQKENAGTNAKAPSQDSINNSSLKEPVPNFKRPNDPFMAPPVNKSQEMNSTDGQRVPDRENPWVRQPDPFKEPNGTGREATPEEKEAARAKQEAARSIEEKAFVQKARERVDFHEEHKGNQSYLGKFADALYDEDDKALEQFETLTVTMERQLRENGKVRYESLKDAHDQMYLLEFHQRKQEKYDLWTNVVSKTAPLFIPGTTGWALSAGVNALDAASPSDSLGRQAVDLALGSTKGLAIRGTLALAPRVTGSIALQAVGLGVAGRMLDAGLSSRSYIDPATNKVDLSRGLDAVIDRTFNPYAIAGDVFTLGIGHIGIRHVNALTGGIIYNSPVAGTLTMGGIYGMANGFSSEALRQYKANEFNKGQFFAAGFQGLKIGIVAAAPGAIAGHLMQPRAREIGSLIPSRGRTIHDSGTPTGTETSVPQIPRFRPLWRESGNLDNRIPLPKQFQKPEKHISY